MPNKHNTALRYHLPKMAFKVQNWREYEAGLVRRGILALWIEEGTIKPQLKLRLTFSKASGWQIICLSTKSATATA